MKKSLLILTLIALTGLSAYLYATKTPTADTLANKQPSESQVEVISSDKPESFENVEMVTYRSEYGFEIAYPENWTVREQQILVHGGYQGGELEEVEYLIVAPEDNGVVGSSRTDSVFIRIGAQAESEELPEPDLALREKLISINDHVGIFSPAIEAPIDMYYFWSAGMLYTIELYHASNNTNEEEALWILSTFKIVK